MKKDILHLAMDETILHIKEMKTSKTFKSITEKYIKLHNMGIFINFSFNSSDATGLFGSFSHRYNFPIEIEIKKEFNRDRVLYFADLERGRVDKIKSLKNELRNNNDIVEEFERSIKHFNLKLPSTSILSTPGVIEKSYNENDLITLVLGLFFNRKKELEMKIRKTEKDLTYIRNSSNKIRYAEDELQNTEVEFFKIVLKRYISAIERYATSMFMNKKVCVVYSEKEWIEFYKTKRNNERNLSSTINGISNFEYMMIDLLKEKTTKIKVKIYDTEFTYTVSKSGINCDYAKEPINPYKERLKDLYVQFDNFKEEYPEFFLATKLLSQLDSKVKHNDSLKIIIVNFLRANNSVDVISRYDCLVKEIQDNEKQKFSPLMNIVRPKFNEVFPHLKIDTQKEKDMAYWYALQQEKYNEVIVSLSNNEFVFPLLKYPK